MTVMVEGNEAGEMSYVRLLRKRRYVAAVAVVALLGGMPACSSSSNAEESTDTLIAVAPDEPTGYSMDAGDPGGWVGTEVVINTQTTLIRNPYIKDPKTGVLKQDWYKFEGVLAKSYDVSSDGLVYKFHLHGDVKSQAGNPLTADDVLWSMERHFNTPTSSTKFIFGPYVDDLKSQLVKVDDHTVELKLKHSGDGFTVLSLLSNMDTEIFDSTVLKQHVTSDDPYAVKWSAANTGWGFGAYTVESHTPGESTVLVANPNYVFGTPKFRKIIFKLVPDAGTRMTSLQAGDAQMATAMAPAQLANLSSDTKVNTFKVATNGLLHLPLVTTKAPFNNVKVRQAMAYAVPYDEILSNVYKGYATRMGSLIPPDSPNYDGDGLAPLTYDPAKAKSLLAEAGVSLPVKFSLAVNGTIPDAKAAAVLIQSYAKDAGFDITIDERSSADYQEARNKGVFQAFMDRNGANVQSPAYQLSLWTGKGSPFNLAAWESQKFYDAMDKALAVSDPFSKEAMVAWNAVEQILRKEMPIVDIAHIAPTAAFAKTVNGFAVRSDGYIDLANLRQ
jgi:peptide/nickel transport system substrate-binding protein